MKGIEAGKQILSEQRYEFIDFIETGNKIVAEARWSGVTKTMLAHQKKVNN
jgi:hypothetical protein